MIWAVADKLLWDTAGYCPKEVTMDRQTLRARLEARSKEAVERALDAMEAAPLTDIIGGSEMQVREVFEGLKREIFQELVQAKVEDAEAAAKGVFSPSKDTAGTSQGGALARQGRSRAPRSHGQR